MNVTTIYNEKQVKKIPTAKVAERFNTEYHSMPQEVYCLKAKPFAYCVYKG